MSDALAVIGAGGHAKVVVSVARALGIHAIELFDDRPATWGSLVLGAPVVGSVDALRAGGRKAVVAVGDNRARKRIVESLSLAWVSLVHPRAYVDPSVRVGEGCVVFAGAVVQPDAALGTHAIVNTGATVDHDCEVGAYAHVAPGVHLCGNVAVGEGALVGVSACARPGVKIGAWATVAAGAACARDVSPGEVVAGVPARVLVRR